MGKETFGYTEIEKPKFHQRFHQISGLISIGNANINKIIVSNKVPFGKKGFKYFIGYKNDRKVRPLCIAIQKCVHAEDILMKLNLFFYKR